MFTPLPPATHQSTTISPPDQNDSIEYIPSHTQIRERGHSSASNHSNDDIESNLNNQSTTPRQRIGLQDVDDLKNKYQFRKKPSSSMFSTCFGSMRRTLISMFVLIFILTSLYFVVLQKRSISINMGSTSTTTSDSTVSTHNSIEGNGGVKTTTTSKDFNTVKNGGILQVKDHAKEKVEKKKPKKKKQDEELIDEKSLDELLKEEKPKKKKPKKKRIVKKQVVYQGQEKKAKHDEVIEKYLKLIDDKKKPKKKPAVNELDDLKNHPLLKMDPEPFVSKKEQQEKVEKKKEIPEIQKKQVETKNEKVTKPIEEEPNKKENVQDVKSIEETKKEQPKKEEPKETAKPVDNPPVETPKIVEEKVKPVEIPKVEENVKDVKPESVEEDETPKQVEKKENPVETPKKLEKPIEKKPVNKKPIEKKAKKVQKKKPIKKAKKQVKKLKKKPVKKAKKAKKETKEPKKEVDDATLLATHPLFQDAPHPFEPPKADPKETAEKKPEAKQPADKKDTKKDAKKKPVKKANKKKPVKKAKKPIKKQIKPKKAAKKQLKPKKKPVVTKKQTKDEDFSKHPLFQEEAHPFEPAKEDTNSKPSPATPAKKASGTPPQLPADLSDANIKEFLTQYKAFYGSLDGIEKNMDKKAAKKIVSFIEKEYVK